LFQTLKTAKESENLSIKVKNPIQLSQLVKEILKKHLNIKDQLLNPLELIVYFSL